MIEWVIGFLAVMIGYITFLIRSSSGSHFEDNSIDAFIIKDGKEIGNKQQGTKKDKYRRNYTSEGRQILIIYGTEYGFSEEVARNLHDRITSFNSTSGTLNVEFQPRTINAKHYSSIVWDQETVCIVIISTSGDGVPPTDARDFYEFLSKSSPNMSHLKFCVLALGDSNYPQYCKTGKVVNQRFLDMSCNPILQCELVDSEDWNVINPWIDKVINLLPNIEIEVKMDYLDLEGLGEGEGHSRNNPFMAKLKVKKQLTVLDDTEDRETIHCEFDIADSGLTWTSGDALGIYPDNHPIYVDNILSLLGINGTVCVDPPVWAYITDKDKIRIMMALMKFYDLKHVKPELLYEIKASLSESLRSAEYEHLFEIFESDDALVQYIKTREVMDVLEEFSAVMSIDMTPEKFLSLLKPLQPRYYSISSSPLIDPNTACITAAVVRYKSEEIQKKKEGVTTAYLQDRLVVMDTCPVFISRNPDFRLPSNHEIPIILIGPGTGLAPFRAFIQEREMAVEHESVIGPTLLYFGCRHKEKDFLYRNELETWHRKGIIQLRTAFSRDQDRKVYVQDLLLEDGNKLWHLIYQNEGIIYVCGDARRMAHDVHYALLEIAQVQGHLSETDATKYFYELEQEGRYQKDVWVT
ncbi:hypothetical protein FSP39_023835 [Pinctada imbricata]|uniref:NADPH--cytochrome P450 reductase n=1 Tax=Pinctada imbricata TaxID=66713 RepID=A0AA89BJT8_PINIB|nr:hypothetical protein FSP39_023835 [Pinctada imbricata]